MAASVEIRAALSREVTGRVQRPTTRWIFEEMEENTYGNNTTVTHVVKFSNFSCWIFRFFFEWKVRREFQLKLWASLFSSLFDRLVSAAVSPACNARVKLLQLSSQLTTHHVTTATISHDVHSRAHAHTHAWGQICMATVTFSEARHRSANGH